MTEFFPRTSTIPSQSPLFWVSHKDRYLRQLLIKDIEADTERVLIVYFTDTDRTQAQIDPSDDVYMAELLQHCYGKPVDLLLETNGGFTDATEKICSLLRKSAPDLRVIIPRKAKSNGTVIALCGNTILMGNESELGPIDPSINGLPVEFILDVPAGHQQPNFIDIKLAQTARDQTKKLAKELLSDGMMSKCDPTEIDDTIEKIATRNHFHSHGSVMDHEEASSLKLNVTYMQPEDELWRKIWLLRTMYNYDCGQSGYAKLFESSRVSTAIEVQQKQS